jgi:hypothetical protein
VWQQQYTINNCLVQCLQVLRADPSDCKMLANRSRCWLRLGDGEKALKDVIKCKNNYKNLAEVHHCHGEALMMLKVLETTFFSLHFTRNHIRLAVRLKSCFFLRSMRKLARCSRAALSWTPRTTRWESCSGRSTIFLTTGCTSLGLNKD